jgi:hypothetical protein
MQLHHGSLTIVLLLTLGPALSAAELAGGKSDLGDNAALQYWQAFSQMAALDEEQKKLLDEWPTVSLDDPAVQKILDESHKSMLYLRRAARCERCDWGLEYNDGIGLLLPHLAKSRELARLAALHARAEYERGNRKALPETAIGMMTLARHVGRDPMMICLLVRFLIEGIVIDLVAPYVPEVKASYDGALTTFKELPPAPDLRQCVRAEKRYFMEWLINKFKEEEDREMGASVKLWHQMLGPDAPQELKEIDSFGQIMKLTADLPPVHDELEKLVALPKPEFDEQYQEFRKRVTADSALVRYFLPDVEQLLAKEHRNDARMAMLLAAVAVAESGPEKLKAIKDPFGDGPFEYHALDSGFELQSTLEFEGKPVALTFGRQPAK